MDEFPSQSHKTRELEHREVQPVTRQPSKIRKPSVGRRLSENLFHGSLKDSWSTMMWESFVPSIGDAMENALHNALSALFGGTGSAYRSGPQSRGRASNISRHNPDRALGGSTPAREQRLTRSDRERLDTSMVEIASRAEAQSVLDGMLQILDQYDIVTLADFYGMNRITAEHTDFTYGWEDLGGAQIMHNRGSYYLDLPTPTHIRR